MPPSGVRTMRSSSRFGEPSGRRRRSGSGPGAAPTVRRRRAYDATSSVTSALAFGVGALRLRRPLRLGGASARPRLAAVAAVAAAAFFVVALRLRAAPRRRPPARRRLRPRRLGCGGLGSAASAGGLLGRRASAWPGAVATLAVGFRSRAGVRGRSTSRRRRSASAALGRGLRLGDRDVAADVDAPAGQAGGEPGVLALAADGQREHPLGHGHVRDPVLLVDVDREDLGRRLSALATNTAGSSFHGMTSIFSPPSSATTAWTRAPRWPTVAPTGSRPVLARRDGDLASGCPPRGRWP